MKNKRILGILLAILLVILVAVLLFAKKGNVKASVLRDLESDSQTSITDLVTDYEKEMNEHLAVMAENLKDLEKGQTLTEEQMEELNGRYQSFSKEIKSLLAEMKEQVGELEEQKLDKVDLVAYQKEMASQIAGMKSDIAKVEIKDSTNSKENEKVLLILEKMEKDLVIFQNNYENNNAQMEKDMKNLQKEIGERKDTIFENFENGLWKAMEEYEKSMQECSKKSNQMEQAISSHQMTLEEMKKTSDSNLNAVHGRLESLESNTAKKLDITAFQTYQEGMNLTIDGMLSEIDGLKTALATETKNRTESDAEINARIDALTQSWNSFQVNGTMTLEQIESSLAALQQVIGNEDISSYGNGTVSGAIAALWEQCGDCRIYYDETNHHFYAEYMDGEQMVLRQLDYVNE